MIVVADTTPINYLVLIGEEELLHVLFGRGIIPGAVLRELQSAATPQAVRQWIAGQPDWLETKATARDDETSLFRLDEGERAAIQLAVELSAGLLLVDDQAARREAASRKLATSGTLGILDRAADKGLADFSQALLCLKQTSFYLPPAVE